MKPNTNPILPVLARNGMLGIGIPAREGGSGGDLADLFDAVARTARESVPAARIFAVQRQFAEVLRRSENVGLAEYRLGYVLEGLISGACTATWPERPFAPLLARETGAAWRLSGVLPPVPNVGEGWYLVTAMLQSDTQSAPCLAILSSEQEGLGRTTVAGATEADDTAEIAVHDAFFRADEILQDDAGQMCEELRLFSSYLRCAIDAGVAERATASMSRQESTAVRAALARTVNSLIGNRSRLRGLPSVDELRSASRLLNLLHTAA